MDIRRSGHPLPGRHHVTEARPFLALAWMLGAAVSFSAMAVAGRELTVEMNTFELMLYRSIIGFAIICALMARSRRGLAQARTTRIKQHLTRNLFHYTGQNLWFYGVAVIPLSQLVALEFTNPIWVAILAPLLLGEALTRRGVFAALVGFIGVLIVARPGIAPLEWGHAAGLGAAIGFAINTITTKRLMATETVLNVLFWMTLLQGLASLVLSLPGGIPIPTAEGWLWVGVVAICGLTAHYSLTSALGAAPATIVAPLEFIRLPVVAVLGMVLYAEPLEAAVFVGAGVIVLANIINLMGRRRQNAAF